MRHCDGCATGDPVTCVFGPQVFGSGILGAGQATRVAVPSADFQMLAIPDGVDDEAALLLTDNLNTGWIGAKRADTPPGGTVVVLGLARSDCAPCVPPSPWAPVRCWPSTRWPVDGPWPPSPGPSRWRGRRWRR